MRVKPDSFKKLIAVTKGGKITNLDITLMRKPFGAEVQNKKIKKVGICISCDYRFAEKNITWSKKIKAICHPFRIKTHLPPSVPQYLLSESDFCDDLLTAVGNPSKIPKYDFVYFTLLSRQGIKCKGLYMLRLIDRAARELGLNGLIVDYCINDSKKYKRPIYKNLLKIAKNEWKSFTNIETKHKLFTDNKLSSVITSAKFVLFPNTADSSPRIITESIVNSRPVVVNRNIYGGWKYVNENSGRFFDAPGIEDAPNSIEKECYLESLKRAMKEVLVLDQSKIRDSYYKEFGFLKTSKRLADIVFDVTGKRYRAVAFKDWKKQLLIVSKQEGWIK